MSSHVPPASHPDRLAVALETVAVEMRKAQAALQTVGAQTDRISQQVIGPHPTPSPLYEGILRDIVTSSASCVGSSQHVLDFAKTLLGSERP